MKKIVLAVLLLAGAAQAQKRTAFAPGQPWPDNHGTHLNAHGAGALYDRGRYYLFGEHKIAGSQGNSAKWACTAIPPPTSTTGRTRALPWP